MQRVERQTMLHPERLGGIFELRKMVLAPLQEFCTSHGLWLIEDAAQAIGAQYRGLGVGSFGATGAGSAGYPAISLVPVASPDTFASRPALRIFGFCRRSISRLP